MKEISESAVLGPAAFTCIDRSEAHREFKKFLIETTKDKTWPLLTLEFKLYAVRHPELRLLYDLMSSLSRGGIQEALFGEVFSAQQMKLNRNGVAILPLLSSLALETFFQPHLLSQKRLEELLIRVLDLLLQT